MRRQQPTSLGDKREVTRRDQISHFRGQKQEDLFAMCRVVRETSPAGNGRRKPVQSGSKHVFAHRRCDLSGCCHAEVS